MGQRRQELVLAPVGVPQRLHRLLLVFDVGAGAEPLYDPTLAVPDRHAPCLEPAVLSVMAADAVLQVVVGSVSAGFPPQRRRPFPVVGVD